MPEDLSNLQIINNFYISLDEQRISRHRTIPQQVNFDFNSENLSAIARMQVNHNSLSFDSGLMANLRYYSLLQCHNIMRSGLTFTSYYCQAEKKVAVISSNISVQGQISQQIRQDFLVNLSLLETITKAHYWSIEQILKQLPFNYQRKNSLLSWILALLITFVLAILVFYVLSSMFFTQEIAAIITSLIAIITILLLIKFSIQTYIKKFLFKLILEQLLFGFFSHNTARREFSIALMEYFS
ncbi:hypothetical protein Xen7305DRAFT_00005870 [Xenococcus sp. PCC 7305]|uniref:hypothetical protein n=1 Tax=Xenococcus sp. PCC 7305 TaxID=102125 RepID=UPI0002AC4CCA|nr:hypothetical protein [Xenococcus sp. PCC 7305]ELS00886.1 hypothetical protein Xen7305DRAFT_00005870 [Xenococcus sp. PCC 7305]